MNKKGILSEVKYSSANTVLLAFIFSVSLWCGEQCQSEAVTKETDERLLYIHTETHTPTVYTNRTLLPLTHTGSLTVSPPQTYHLHSFLKCPPALMSVSKIKK